MMLSCIMCHLLSCVMVDVGCMMLMCEVCVMCCACSMRSEEYSMLLPLVRVQYSAVQYSTVQCVIQFVGSQYCIALCIVLFVLYWLEFEVSSL